MDKLSSILFGSAIPANDFSNWSREPRAYPLPDLHALSQSAFQIYHPDPLNSHKSNKRAVPAGQYHKKTSFELPEFITTQDQSRMSYHNASDQDRIQKLRIREDSNTLGKVIEVIPMEKYRSNQVDVRTLKDQKDSFTQNKMSRNQILPSVEETLATFNQRSLDINSMDSNVLIENFNKLIQTNYILCLIQNLLQSPNTQSDIISQRDTINTFRDETDDVVLRQRENFNQNLSAKRYFDNDINNLEKIKSLRNKSIKDDKENFSYDIKYPLFPQLIEVDKEKSEDTGSVLEISFGADNFTNETKNCNTTYKSTDKPDLEVIEIPDLKYQDIREHQFFFTEQGNQNKCQEQGKAKSKNEKAKKGRKPNKKEKGSKSTKSSLSQENDSTNPVNYDFFEFDLEGKEGELPLPKGEFKLGENSEDGNTRVGPRFQAEVFPLGSRKEVKRVPKLKWAPTILEEEQRNLYYSELARIFGKKEVTNEAIALGTLIKNEMNFDKAFEEVKSHPTYFKGHFNPGTRILRNGHFY